MATPTQAPSRRTCPSCRFRLSPLAIECPVCGLTVVRPDSRPLLFQASGITHGAPPAQRPRVLDSPALGRVPPIAVEVQETEPAEPLAFLAPLGFTEESEGGEPLVQAPKAPAAPSFWPLVKLEICEAGVLVLTNLALALVIALASGAPLTRLYDEVWIFLLLVHLAISWALFLVPLTLTGQSPLMGRFGMVLDAEQPERRLAFSLFHLLSVLLFPLSFLTMVLSRNHQSLAELATGQEVLMRPR